MSYSSEALAHTAYVYESSPQVSLKANTASPINEDAAAAWKHNEKEPICLLTGRSVSDIGKGKRKLQIHKQYYPLYFLSSVSVLCYTFKMILGWFINLKPLGREWYIGEYYKIIAAD